MDGPAPAVLNALADALAEVLESRSLDEVPMTPERLLGRAEEVSRG